MKLLCGLINRIYEFFIILAVISLLFLANIIPFYKTNEFPLINLAYLGIDIVVALLIFLCVKAFSKKVRKFDDKRIKRIVIILAVIIGIAQFAFNYFRYFYQGWDVFMVYDTVQKIMFGDITNINTVYFSAYSNNLFIVFVYRTIGYVTNFFHVELYVGLLAFHQIINVFAAILVFSITKRIVNKDGIALFAFILYEVYIGFNPWFIVAYSDSVSVVCPLLIIYFYGIISDISSISKKCFLSFLMMMLTTFSFFLKPQNIISTIAVLIILLLKSINNHKEITTKSSSWLYVFISGFCGLILAIFLVKVVFIPSLNIITEPEYKFGPHHWIMMGLNDVTDGGFLDGDVDISIKYLTTNERVAYEKEIISQRLSNYGFGGFIYHLLKKNMVNYCDGSFAWFAEGDFCPGIPEYRLNDFSLSLYKWIMPQFDEYKVFLSICQCFWIFVIVSMLLGCIFSKNKDNSIKIILVLSIIGISLFELIFEARARYLFAFSPIYIILAADGINSFVIWINDLRKNN